MHTHISEFTTVPAALTQGVVNRGIHSFAHFASVEYESFSFLAELHRMHLRADPKHRADQPHGISAVLSRGMASNAASSARRPHFQH